MFRILAPLVLVASLVVCGSAVEISPNGDKVLMRVNEVLMKELDVMDGHSHGHLRFSGAGQEVRFKRKGKVYEHTTDTATESCTVHLKKALGCAHDGKSKTQMTDWKKCKKM